MKIGYYQDRYPERRNIINMIQDKEYIKVYNFNNLYTKILKIINKMFNKHYINNFQSSFNDYGFNHIDIIHFFNTISFGSTPWVTTFETKVPRDSTIGKDPSSLVNNKDIERELEAMCDDSCKRLIAISEATLEIEKNLLKYFPKYYSRLEKKFVVLHPPQKLLIDNFKSKGIQIDGSINFMFIGRLFHRKGGMEILEIFKELHESKKYKFNLIIVSSISTDNFVDKVNKDSINLAKEMIKTNSDFIEYYDNLPNIEVLKIMKEKAHIGLLPTFADTYGYSVLEFQAAGCPVISTNIRALPEINNNDIGWMIDVPKNNLGEGLYQTNENKIKMEKAIKNGLKNAIVEALENREMIPIKADKAIERIKIEHSPEEYSKKLNKIYNS